MAGADLRLRLDAEERPNYLIAAEDPAATGATAASDGFTFDLQGYQIADSKISYMDQSSGISFLLEDIQHTGSGDLSLAESRLETRTDARISLGMDSVQYLDRNSLQLDARIGIDLETDTYTFLENEGLINQMPLVFEGSVQLVEEGQEIDLDFRTPSSDFKNFLALIPEARRRGVEHILITHGLGQQPSRDQIAEMVRQGAVIELVWLAVHNGEFRLAEYTPAITEFGASHFLLSSDFGQENNPLHTDGLKAFIAGLSQEGISDADIDLMIRRNPARLLGLDP